MDYLRQLSEENSSLKKENTFLRECLSAFQKGDRDKLFEKLDMIRVDRDEWFYNYHEIAENLSVVCCDVLLIDGSFRNSVKTLPSDISTAMKDVEDIDKRIKTNCF